ncbi:DUF5641 domain-containing protein [Trichonephila clavipes]|nr:DUF5641 domain-containing protein [Trichonephila clavipes]
MEPGSKAERLVLSFPATAANYPKAIDQLKEKIWTRRLISTNLRSRPVNFVESCLPEEVLVAWERSRNHQTESEGSRSLEQLMNFLRQEVKGEEMVLLARTGLTLHQNPRKKDYHATQINKVETTTAAALVNMDNPDLRQRFRNEYLSQLIQKHNEKESRDPEIGEVVLVGDDNKKRLFWALAKIIELIPGRDGKIRTVRLKTQHGKMLRPIQRIYPLEIRSNENLQRDLVENTVEVEDKSHEEEDNGESEELVEDLDKALDLEFESGVGTGALFHVPYAEKIP